MDATEQRAKLAEALAGFGDLYLLLSPENIRSLLDELDRAEAKLAGVEKERDEARVEANNNILSADAVRVIREMLTEQGVPVAAFIDDHVANAIVQRNEANARAAASEAALSETRDRAVKALEPFAQACSFIEESFPERRLWADNIAAYSGLRAPTIGELRLARQIRSELLKDGGGNP